MNHFSLQWNGYITFSNCTNRPDVLAYKNRKPMKWLIMMIEFQKVICFQMVISSLLNAKWFHSVAKPFFSWRKPTTSAQRKTKYPFSFYKSVFLFNRRATATVFIYMAGTRFHNSSYHFKCMVQMGWVWMWTGLNHVIHDRNKA